MPRIQEPTLRENRDRRDADLRRAARALLDSEGPDGVSMGAVATAAGLSRAAAYEYFPSTADLVCAVIIDELRAWGRSVTAGRHASDSPEESVTTFVADSLRVLTDGTCSPEVIRSALWLPRDARPRTAEAWASVTAGLRSSGGHLLDASIAQLAATIVLECALACGDGMPIDDAMTSARGAILGAVGIPSGVPSPPRSRA